MGGTDPHSPPPLSPPDGREGLKILLQQAFSLFSRQVGREGREKRVGVMRANAPRTWTLSTRHHRIRYSIQYTTTPVTDTYSQMGRVHRASRLCWG
jgi:hypothetical protein